MLKVVASEKASPWEAGLLEEGTGPCHPDPQGNVLALTTAPLCMLAHPGRRLEGGAGERG